MVIFVGYSTQFWALGGFKRPGTLSTSFTKPLKTHDFGHFWPFSWAIAHSFWLQGGFNWLDTSFTIGKKLVISGISGRFRGI